MLRVRVDFPQGWQSVVAGDAECMASQGLGDGFRASCDVGFRRSDCHSSSPPCRSGSSCGRESRLGGGDSFPLSHRRCGRNFSENDLLARFERNIGAFESLSVLSEPFGGGIGSVSEFAAFRHLPHRVGFDDIVFLLRCLLTGSGGRCRFRVQSALSSHRVASVKRIR